MERDVDYSLDSDVCPSGCLSTAVCANIRLIDALSQQEGDLIEAVTSGAAEATKSLNGDIKSLLERDRVNEATRSALFASCRLVQKMQ